ncbi:MAG TPA: glycosyltransferase [Anaerovoracaceae bacterium]|nr:glycosyltransferase [Anaerovoracaceae bacterium]
MSNLTINLNLIQKDWRVLDNGNFKFGKNIRIISHENFSFCKEYAVEQIKQNKMWEIFASVPVIYYLLYSLKLLLSCDKDTIAIVNGGVFFMWFWCGILNHLPVIGNKKLLCWDLFVEYKLGREKKIPFLPFVKLSIKHKEQLARFIMSNYITNVVWSATQVETHSLHFNLPREKFVFIPFKANHSKEEPYDIKINNYIFAGGNGKRDYKTLVDAVDGTGIPVIISATDPAVRKNIRHLSNVVVVGATEPAFAQLQAGSRFVVIPMIDSGLKGGGEANFCNAMWHGKAVIAVDNISAKDYVVEGETGYIVPSGDATKLKSKILKLWNTPHLCEQMGSAGRRHVIQNFTHSLFIKRLIRLASACGES